MPAKKTALTEAARWKRIRETAREHDTDNDPESFERAFRKVVQPTPLHERPIDCPDNGRDAPKRT
jgi:hypothetical protein